MSASHVLSKNDEGLVPHHTPSWPNDTQPRHTDIHASANVNVNVAAYHPPIDQPAHALDGNQGHSPTRSLPLKTSSLTMCTPVYDAEVDVLSAAIPIDPLGLYAFLPWMAAGAHWAPDRAPS